MQRRDIVVIGASAGGVAALRELVGALPAVFPASMFIVLHVGRSPSRLTGVLAAARHLPVSDARTGSPIERGRIYVAPPDMHLLLEDGRIRTWHGPKENRARPAIDPLFRSAAGSFGARTIGVILSGALDDGVAGMLAISAGGGTTIVQSPAEAAFPALPSNVLRTLAVDHVLGAAGIGRKLGELVVESAPGSDSAAPGDFQREQQAMHGMDPDAMRELAEPTPLTCPECNGALFKLDRDGLVRFRCHTGHGFTAATLIVAQDESVEIALYGALRALRERAALLRQLAQRARSLAHEDSAAEHERRADRAEGHATTVETLLRSCAEGTASAAETR